MLDRIRPFTDTPTAFYIRRARTLFASLGIFLLPIAPLTSAHAQGEDCEQCKYLRCLEDTIAQKQRLIAVYEGLRNFWAPRHLDNRDQPVMVRNLSGMTEPERSRVYGGTLRQLEQFAEMERVRTEHVGRPESCGYPADTDVHVSTDSFQFCKTDAAQLSAAMALAPCKQIAAMIAAHEASHVTACKQRQRGKYWRFTMVGADGQRREHLLPPGIVTPAGKAAEEIAAYQGEIRSLQVIAEKLRKKCRQTSFSKVTIDCIIRTPAGRFRMGQHLTGRVCGDPVEANWIIKPVYFVEGPHMPPTSPEANKPFDTDCVPAGSALEQERAQIYQSSRGMGAGGWMCVYHAEPRPRITIRSFRLAQCDGPAEQTVTVDAEVSDKCEGSSASEPSIPDGLPRS